MPPRHSQRPHTPFDIATAGTYTADTPALRHCDAGGFATHTEGHYAATSQPLLRTRDVRYALQLLRHCHCRRRHEMPLLRLALRRR